MSALLCRFFQRAVQVDGRFAYAHTLLGHEYVLVEELEKALSCFRTALRHPHTHKRAYNEQRWFCVGVTSVLADLSDSYL